jgi:transposase
MNIDLSFAQKTFLEALHKKERDGRVRDRIKAVLLHAEGWTQIQIAQALRIPPETVQDHLNDYRRSEKLKPENGGSESKLNPQQTTDLVEHLKENTYATVVEICSYVEATWDVRYTVSGMTKWLHQQKFAYKKPKQVPAKADLEKQAAFIKYYETLMNHTSEDEPIEFGDGVHPTMATKLSYGWIFKKNDKFIKTTGARTGLNLMGSLNLETMNITIGCHHTLDSRGMEKHFQLLRQKYPQAKNIHLILDRGRYNTSRATQEAAKKYGIKLHYLPPYSPNLNPIERVWKVMNEYVRNNQFFASADDFRRSIMDFFHKTWPRISASMVNRINDNFEILKQVSSS